MEHPESLLEFTHLHLTTRQMEADNRERGTRARHCMDHDHRDVQNSVDAITHETELRKKNLRSVADKITMCLTNQNCKLTWL